MSTNIEKVGEHMIHDMSDLSTTIYIFTKHMGKVNKVVDCLNSPLIVILIVVMDTHDLKFRNCINKYSTDLDFVQVNNNLSRGL